MNVNLFAKANQVLRNSDTAYIGVIDQQGYPSVSTASPIRPEDIFSLFFATGIEANKTKRILADKRASVCFRSGENNVTLVGEAEILTDQSSKSAYWLDWFINHFEKGETDPAYCIIKFTTVRLSLWIDRESAEFSVADLLQIQSRCGLLCDGCSYKISQGCKGCMAMQGQPFWGTCPVATCCEAKGYLHCGSCPEMPCELLQEFSCGSGSEADKPAGARIAMCRAWEKWS